MTRARELSLDDIEALAVGAWILGTGGGGSPYLGLLNMRRLYAEGHRVALMPPDALEDDDWVAAVSNMGAPLVGQKRLTDSRTIARAVALMEGRVRASRSATRTESAARRPAPRSTRAARRAGCSPRSGSRPAPARACCTGGRRRP